MQADQPPMNQRVASYDGATLWNCNRKLAGLLEADATELFRVIDTNGDNHVSREEFIEGITNAPNIDLFEAEANRLFDTMDSERRGFIDLTQFIDVLS